VPLWPSPSPILESKALQNAGTDVALIEHVGRLLRPGRRSGVPLEQPPNPTPCQTVAGRVDKTLPAPPRTESSSLAHTISTIWRLVAGPRSATLWHWCCSNYPRRAALTARLAAPVFRWSNRPTKTPWPNGCRESRKDTPCPAMYESEHTGPGYNRGVGAAGIASGLRRRRRAYAAVTSAPYRRMTAEMYTHRRNTTTAAIDP
jgi:hypothetical protein